MFTDYYDIREWLESFIPLIYGKENLGLARIEYLLNLLGNPQNKFKSIHVAGTSGKGSCAFYTARLLSGSQFTVHSSRKLKVGLHVSPHLNYIGERMQILQSQKSRQGGGRAPVKGRKHKQESLISVDKLIELMNEIRPVVEAMRGSEVGLPSYFEILVAASFLYFAREKVGFAVVEVGLGGRLDATNVLKPELSVITNVDLDHTEILGNTIDAIAKEKAGIIKSSVPIVTSASGRGLEVIEKVAKKKNAPLIKVSTQETKDFLKSDIYRYITRQNDVFRYYPINALLTSVLLPLIALKTLKIKADKEEIENAFKVSFAGRFEEIDKDMILDGAHNADKMRSLIDFVRNSKLETRNSKQGIIRPKTQNLKSIILVVGFKEGKNWKKMVDLLIKNLPVKKVIATKYEAVADTGRGSAVEPEEIAKYVESGYILPTTVYSNSNEAVFEALRQAQGKLPKGSRGNNNLVLITGSLYFVGEVRMMWH